MSAPVGRSNEELVANNHVAVAIAVPGTSEIKVLSVAVNASDQVGSVSQVRIGVKANKQKQRIRFQKENR